MKWVRKTEYFHEESGHRYRISLAWVNGRLIYAAWRRAERRGPHDPWGDPIHYTGDFSGACAACEKDWRQRQLDR